MSTNTDLVAQKDQGKNISKQLPVIAPEVDVFENDQEILLQADMPGVLKEDIVINIDNGKMVLSGIRRLESVGADTWKEFGEVEFRRNFSVPQSIDTNQVNAEFKDGQLCLHLPKSEAAKPRQIEIKAG
ncbi:Hsp20/alpha crystallin family protein [Desulfobulbus rhabdoformis]|jgi:HSP20 family molecular chaperone IbpA|uniref:Hsp20/alpha crystallin family protein n=1 Tax=Desulfobulbus rhabdoformis TaxID=34032 RepID=UPI001963A16C|nr:Hsp20/alpha crystallin family protein [Desulfobulbus rhabdoformis]MBM9616601.1 Hsp20/alpha crystallin family protein [Desulfobulbus rhabdoformis]